MFILLAALALGIVLGYSGWVKGRLVKAVDIASTVVLFVILTIMGAKLASPKVVSALADIGLRGTVFAVSSIVGSLLVVCSPLTLRALARRCSSSRRGEVKGL